MSAIMGFGTYLYGKKDVDKRDGSYTATEWIILLFLPFFPLDSYRVLRGETKLSASLTHASATTEYHYKSKMNKLDIKQVALTYIVGLGCPAVGIWLLANFWIAWLLLLIFVMGTVIYFFGKTLEKPSR